MSRVKKQKLSHLVATKMFQLFIFSGNKKLSACGYVESCSLSVISHFVSVYIFKLLFLPSSEGRNN